LAERKAFYSAVRLGPEEVFPVRFAGKQGLATGIVDGSVLGFYRLVKKDGAWVGEIENDDGRGQCDEVTSDASQLNADPLQWTEARHHDMASTLERLFRKRSSKWNLIRQTGRLHLDVCYLQFAVQAYEGCLAYSDSGLAAVGGYWASRDMEANDLTFLGARALFELGRYQEALDRLSPLWPGHVTTWADASLMTKKELVKACKTALKLQNKKSKKNV
jgi:hypothetical protein